MRKFGRMGSEIPSSDFDWDFALTDDDLRAIDSACCSAADPNRRDGDGASDRSPPKTRRRLPDSLFVSHQQSNTISANKSNSPFSPCSRNRFSGGRNDSHLTTTFQEIKFGGCIIYSRTVEEVERAAEELLDFVEAKKRKEGECILGLDIEWRPTFRRGVPPGKAAVMQICGDNGCCHVLHIIHAGIPKKLQTLLEDCASLKVGVCIANDAAKVFQDHNVSVNGLMDLSDLANQKLSGYPRKWSLSSLTEMLICRKLPKPSNIRLGNWEVNVLSTEQIKYAASDAYVSWYLYQVLKSHPDPAGNTSVEIFTS